MSNSENLKLGEFQDILFGGLEFPFVCHPTFTKYPRQINPVKSVPQGSMWKFDIRYVSNPAVVHTTFFEPMNILQAIKKGRDIIRTDKNASDLLLVRLFDIFNNQMMWEIEKGKKWQSIGY